MVLLLTTKGTLLISLLPISAFCVGGVIRIKQNIITTLICPVISIVPTAPIVKLPSRHASPPIGLFLRAYYYFRSFISLYAWDFAVAVRYCIILSTISKLGVVRTIRYTMCLGLNKRA